MYRPNHSQRAQDFAPANSPEFVTVNLARADNIFPDKESLAKRGWIGKQAAKHRPRLVCAGVFVASLCFLAAVGWFVLIIVQSLRVRASGLNLQEIDTARQANGLIVNGVLVRNVVQPAAQMADTTHALLLMDDSRFSNYTALSEDELLAGFLPWTAAEDRPRVNFTLAHMENLVRAQTDRNETTCVCYAEYGLPYNIVYLSDKDDVLYEPRIVQEFTDRVVRIRSECSLHSLLEETKRRLSKGGEEEPRRIESGKEHFMTTNSSGIVQFMRMDGKRSRVRLDLPEFPCIKHCIRFFGN